jgi:hypothetical protein
VLTCRVSRHPRRQQTTKNRWTFQWLKLFTQIFTCTKRVHESKMTSPIHPKTEKRCEIRSIPDVSGRKFAHKAANKLQTPSKIPMPARLTSDITAKGDRNAPIFETAVQEACPTVRNSVLYSSGVVTHVPF